MPMETGKPHPPSRAQIDAALGMIPANVLEKIAEYVHDSWWQKKIEMGFHHPVDGHAGATGDAKLCDHCHLDMIPYSALAADKQSLDFETIGTTIAGLIDAGYRIIKDGKHVSP